MIHFKPIEILVDPQVEHRPLTQKVLQHFHDVPRRLVTNPQEIKKPISMTEAKKRLYLSEHKGAAIKSCQGMGDYVCCNYYTVSFISNCHFECSYCILQDYLKNNPIITLFTNIDEILGEIKSVFDQKPQEFFRLGTGELSDSLALDDITGLSTYLVSFAAQQKNMMMELKTKSDRVSNLLKLDHQKKTVVSWSISPQSFIDIEEYKCASLKERFQAALAVSDAGYPIAFHLDPLLSLAGWEKEYEKLIIQIASQFKNRNISWISLGSLRFTPGLKNTIKERFPKSQLLYGELLPSEDGKIRYYREVREKLYRNVKNLLGEHLPQINNYLCMETKQVWENVTTEPIPQQQELERQLAQPFMI